MYLYACFWISPQIPSLVDYIQQPMNKDRHHFGSHSSWREIYILLYWAWCHRRRIQCGSHNLLTTSSLLPTPSSSNLCCGMKGKHLLCHSCVFAYVSCSDPPTVHWCASITHETMCAGVFWTRSYVAHHERSCWLLLASLGGTLQKLHGLQKPRRNHWGHSYRMAEWHEEHSVDVSYRRIGFTASSWVLPQPSIYSYYIYIYIECLCNKQ